MDYLTADSELSSQVNGVYSQFWPDRVSLPIVRFFLVEESDLMVVNANRIWTELVFQVEGITRGPDSDEARAVAQRIDQLLHRLQGQSSSTVYVQEVFRRSPLFRRTVEEGDPYVYAGGEYVAKVSAL